MKTLKVIFILLLGVALGLITAIVFWAANPSSKYYSPIGATIERDESGKWVAVVTRELPRGDIQARWSLDVWVRRGEASFVCSEPMGRPIDYLKSNGPVVSYELPASVARCMNAAPPINLTWRRQVILWGWLPLRPVRQTYTIAAPPIPTPREF